jgi:NADH:ubiquinone oxidoreductase subunit 3 (subunit A)
LVRVLACHAKSRGFKSRRSRLDHLFKDHLTYLIVILLCLIQELTIKKNINTMIEYIGVLVYFVIASILALALLILPFLTATRRVDPEKISAYECGFDPFDDARGRFDIQFYLVAILFIIFDLEVTFLFPWAVVLNKVGLFGFWTMMVFLIILTIGFVYEWRKGALDWS